MSLAAKRSAAQYLETAYGVSARRVCRVLVRARSSRRRQPGRVAQVAVVARIHTLPARYPRWGHRQICARLKAEQWSVSRETVRRMRRREELQAVKRGRKQRPLSRSATTPTRAAHRDHVWSDDIVHDETTDGRRLKCLTVLDEHTRECVAIHCARSITAGEVVRVLHRLCSQRGTPTCLKSDNGAEFVAKQVTGWLSEQGIHTRFVEPGSPWQNGHNESCNAVFRDGRLDRWLFASIREARRVIHQWREEYHHERQHGALNGMTPAAFAAHLASQRGRAV